MAAPRALPGLLLVSALAACASPRYAIDADGADRPTLSVPRPRYSVDTREAADAAPPPERRERPRPAPRRPEGSAPRTAPSGEVSSQPLGAGTPAASRPSPYAQGAPRPPVLSTPGRVTVKPGETVFDIAERYRTPVRALIEANHLQPPYALTPGVELILPPPLIYTVQEGDTLFGIARRFNIDPRSLANLNDIALESALTRGQQMALPSLARDQGVNPQAKGASPAGSTLGRSGGAEAGLRGGATAPMAASRPTRLQPKTAAEAREAVAAAASRSGEANVPAAAVAANDAQIVSAGRGRFIPPVKGEVISTYGVKGPGQRNDGVNIAASKGTPVKAAAAGEVVYAGSAIPGFGNLVLVKHAGGWVTAYAHLDSIAVKMRAAVAQGEVLGAVGDTGGVERPQLHFEIRYPPAPDASAKPVDPALLLPQLR